MGLPMVRVLLCVLSYKVSWEPVIVCVDHEVFLPRALLGFVSDKVSLSLALLGVVSDMVLLGICDRVLLPLLGVVSDRMLLGVVSERMISALVGAATESSFVVLA